MKIDIQIDSVFEYLHLFGFVLNLSHMSFHVIFILWREKCLKIICKCMYHDPQICTNVIYHPQTERELLTCEQKTKITSQNVSVTYVTSVP